MFEYSRASLIPVPNYMFRGRLGIRVVWYRAVRLGCGGGGVDSTGPGVVEAGYSGRCVGAGGFLTGGGLYHVSCT